MISYPLVSGTRLAGLFVGAMLLYHSTAFALSCDDQVTKMTTDCMNGDLSKALQCRQWAEAQGCDEYCDKPEVRENVDWVFRDPGARASYERDVASGIEPVDAVILAQSHNLPIQRLLKQCSGYVASYLGQAIQPPADINCSCLSIIPNGDQYRVTNSCQTSFSVAIKLVDASNTTRESVVWVERLTAGSARAIGTPEFPIVSVESALIEQDGLRLHCNL